LNSLQRQPPPEQTATAITKEQKLPVAKGKQDKDKATIIEFYNKKHKHMQPCKISQQRLKNPTAAAPTETETSLRNHRNIQSSGLHPHSYNRHGPFAVLWINHCHDNLFTKSIASSTEALLLLKIRS
jgi:hypothetical protein